LAAGEYVPQIIEPKSSPKESIEKKKTVKRSTTAKRSKDQKA
jgi:hypothetical protein